MTTSASIDFDDEFIKRVALNKPHWCKIRLEPEKTDISEVVTQMENLFPHVLNMIAHKETCDIGLTLMYQIGRNFLLESHSSEADFVYMVEEKSISDPDVDMAIDPNWLGAVEPPVTLQSFLDVSGSADSIMNHMKEKYEHISHDSNELLSHVSGGPSDKRKLGYFGMIGCLMARSIVKDKRSLLYLFQGERTKLSQYYSAFYSATIPYYGLNIKDVVLSNAASRSRHLLEAKTLLLLSQYQFSYYGPESRNKEEVLKAVFLKLMKYHGLPALTWTIDAARATRVTLKVFLTKMMHDKVLHSIYNIANFIDIYYEQNRYLPIAKILNSHLFKNLGREENAEFICACYILKYYYSDKHHRQKLKRFTPPEDRSKYAITPLMSFIQDNLTPTRQGEESKGVSIIRDFPSPSLDEIREEAERTAKSVYHELFETT